jgi:signal transduction histidine kinase
MLRALLANAIKFTPPDGKITAACEVATDYMSFTVEDTGCGIGEEDIPHIFERFYRVDPARGKATGGNGLGLALAKWIVQAHGGEIGVESEVGVGTTFVMRLPREM